MFFLFSCSKDSSKSSSTCYECTVTTTVKTNNSGNSTSTTNQECNKTPDEIKSIEDAGTHTSTNDGVTTEVVTKCVKQ